MSRLIDLTGMKFGRLTVIKRAENKGGKVCWLCKCECGNEKVIVGNNLKSGQTMSCGCLQSEKSSEKIKQQWQDEDFKKMQSEKIKQQWKNEDFREVQSRKTKEKWQDEDFKKMRSKKAKEQWENEDFRKMQSEKMKEQWKNEDFKQMQDKKMKEKWQDEDFRKMQSEKAKKQWQDENYRKMQIKKMKEQWKNEEMKWKMGYKGGITPISMYLRDMQIVKQWRKDTYIRENSKCQLTGNHVHGGNSDVHHLKGFNTIVKEAHDLHNIQIKEIVADYTEEELRLLEEYIVKWHKDTANAVLLSDKIHSLFHSTYGSGNNTPEQYIEFKERYLAGEFKEILNRG